MRPHNPPCSSQIYEGLSKGAIAQLGERLLCTQEVSGSIPLSSTITLDGKGVVRSQNQGAFLGGLLLVFLTRKDSLCDEYKLSSLKS